MTGFLALGLEGMIRFCGYLEALFLGVLNYFMDIVYADKIQGLGYLKDRIIAAVVWYDQA